MPPISRPVPGLLISCAYSPYPTRDALPTAQPASLLTTPAFTFPLCSCAGDVTYAPFDPLLAPRPPPIAACRPSCIPPSQRLCPGRPQRFRAAPFQARPCCTRRCPNCRQCARRHSTRWDYLICRHPLPSPRRAARPPFIGRRDSASSTSSISSSPRAHTSRSRTIRCLSLTLSRLGPASPHCRCNPPLQRASRLGVMCVKANSLAHLIAAPPSSRHYHAHNHTRVHVRRPPPCDHRRNFPPTATVVRVYSPARLGGPPSASCL